MFETYASTEMFATVRFFEAVDVAESQACKYGRCHHRIAYELVTESFLDAVIGPRQLPQRGEVSNGMSDELGACGERNVTP